MVKFTVTIAPAPGGVGVNLREDGAPADAVEAYWRLILGTAIKDTMLAGADALKVVGVLADTQTRIGEEARKAGEARNGTPGEPGHN